jgi:hypothetical protein
MNKQIILSAILLLALVATSLLVVTSPTLILAKKSKSASPAKVDESSAEFRQGALAGNNQEKLDLQQHNGIDAQTAHIKCPPNSSPTFCAGFKAGYQEQAEIDNE